MAWGGVLRSLPSAPPKWRDMRTSPCVCVCGRGEGAGALVKALPVELEWVWVWVWVCVGPGEVVKGSALCRGDGLAEAAGVVLSDVCTPWPSSPSTCACRL